MANFTGHTLIIAYFVEMDILFKDSFITIKDHSL